MGYGLPKTTNKSNRIIWEGEPKTVKVQYMKDKLEEVESRVGRDTGKLGGKSGDHPVRLNTTWEPIVNEYREGKVKRTPGGE